MPFEKFRRHLIKRRGYVPLSDDDDDDDQKQDVNDYQVEEEEEADSPPPVPSHKVKAPKLPPRTRGKWIYVPPSPPPRPSRTLTTPPVPQRKESLYKRTTVRKTRHDQVSSSSSSDSDYSDTNTQYTTWEELK